MSFISVRARGLQGLPHPALPGALGQLRPCTVRPMEIDKRGSWESLIYCIKAPQMSLKFDSKWARRNLQTASSLSLLCSEITSDQINGRLAIQWSFFFSLTLPELILSELIIMNHYLWMRGNLFSLCGLELRLNGLGRRCSTLPSAAVPVKWVLCCCCRSVPPYLEPAIK